MLLLYYSVIFRDLVLLDIFPSATCVEEKTINHSARYGLEIPGEYGLSEAKILFNGWRKRQQRLIEVQNKNYQDGENSFIRFYWEKGMFPQRLFWFLAVLSFFTCPLFGDNFY